MTTIHQKRTATAKPGTRAGVSESIVEMAAESIDPAMWATLQLTKPDQPPAKTVGDIHERIKVIMAQALDMTMAEKWNVLMRRLDTVAGMYEQMHATAHDPKAKRGRRIQAETMREAMVVVREVARREHP